ncbi:MAG: tetratricopeptide repeat protein [Polaromonas sp.]|nr:tetratricopeptide repeat protein [Polaromonas sp.]
MKHFLCTLAGLWLALAPATGYTAPAVPASGQSPVATLGGQKAKEVQIPSSALDAQLFYQLLIGELSAGAGEPGPAVSLILDAAQKTKDVQLYQRATELALQSRSGEAALQAARAWKKTHPTSIEASRYTLQILLALNRVAESAEPLKSLVELTPTMERPQTFAAVPRLYARTGDKKLAATLVEQTLAPYFSQPGTAAPAWAMAGRLRLAAGDMAGALEAANRGQAADAQAEGPVLVALELMDPKRPQAEAMVSQYLVRATPASPELRMAYVRNLLNAERYANALTQLQILLKEKPDFAQGWLVLGSLQLQEKKPALAETSLKKYVALAEQQAPEEENSRGLAQAFFALAQIAEMRQDLAGAQAWLKRIENPDMLMQAQMRRASLLGKQGKLQDGLQLIRDLPERKESDKRSKLMAQSTLLKEFKQYQPAYELIAQAITQAPSDIELIYEQAMNAEKLNKLDEMEQLLRHVISLKPDYHAAYNALGYSLADRNLRLPEAKVLIQQAVAFAPTDPFIQDSLGWVEFRLGNQAEALRLLEAAFKARPDSEIAAHLGEVLWQMGQRERAQAIWKEGRQLNPENETLLETLKRLRVKL